MLFREKLIYFLSVFTLFVCINGYSGGGFNCKQHLASAKAHTALTQSNSEAQDFSIQSESMLFHLSTKLTESSNPLFRNFESIVKLFFHSSNAPLASYEVIHYNTYCSRRLNEICPSPFYIAYCQLII
jgi:hypothetical protein